MQTEITLTERQQEILITAAIDHDGHLEPAAASVNIRGAACANMMHTLRNAGLAEGEDAETRLTPAGYAAISVDAPAPAKQDVQEPASTEPEEIVETAPEAEADATPEAETTAPEPESEAAASSDMAPEPEIALESEAAPQPETLTKKPRKMRTGTKQATIIEMLQRAEGASLTQIMEATGWQMHTTRAVLSRTIQKDLGIPLTSEKTSGGDRIYRIARSTRSKTWPQKKKSPPA